MLAILMNQPLPSKESPQDACPIAKVIALFGDAWSILIIRDLLSGPKRFGSLLASLQGISSRTLTQKLKSLEQKRFIRRQEFHEKPPRVEYTITQKGEELHGIINAMKKFGEKYLD